MFISQTTDFHFVSFHFVLFHFVSQTTVSQILDRMSIAQIPKHKFWLKFSSKQFHAKFKVNNYQFLGA